MSRPCQEEQMANLLAPPQDPYLVGVAHDAHAAFMETQPGPYGFACMDVKREC